MKLLTAASGTRPDDFSYGVPGELVYCGIVCDRDAKAGRDQGCGCGRAFIGLVSCKATTLAFVIELDIDFDGLVAIATEPLVRAGYDIEDLPEIVADMVEDAEDFEVGDRVRRWLDDLESEV